MCERRSAVPRATRWLLLVSLCALVHAAPCSTSAGHSLWQYLTSTFPERAQNMGKTYLNAAGCFPVTVTANNTIFELCYQSIARQFNTSSLTAADESRWFGPTALNASARPTQNITYSTGDASPFSLITMADTVAINGADFALECDPDMITSTFVAAGSNISFNFVCGTPDNNATYTANFTDAGGLNVGTYLSTRICDILAADTTAAPTTTTTTTTTTTAPTTTGAPGKSSAVLSGSAITGVVAGLMVGALCFGL